MPGTRSTSEEEALKFEAALFEDLRRTVRHFRDWPVKIERLSLVGWRRSAQRGVAHGRDGHDEEHAGDAGRLDALGEVARGNVLLRMTL
jgi:hypothetical protein